MRAPERMPSRIASWNRKMYLPTYSPRIRGRVVATAPQRKRLMPCVRSPLTNPGPAEMPTMAMKIFKPTEFMNHTVGEGMRPKEGRVERSQPRTSPAMSAPPAVDKVSGTPRTFQTSAPTKAPTAIPAPIKATSAMSVGRSATPSILAVAEVSCVRPTIVRMSPR